MAYSYSTNPLYNQNYNLSANVVLCDGMTCGNVVCNTMICENSVKSNLIVQKTLTANVITSNVIVNNGNLTSGNISFSGILQSINGVLKANLDNDVVSTQQLNVSYLTNIEGSISANSDLLKLYTGGNLAIGPNNDINNCVDAISIGKNNNMSNTNESYIFGENNVVSGWNTLALGENINNASFGSTLIGKNITNNHDGCVMINNKGGSNSISSGGQDRFYLKPIRALLNPGSGAHPQFSLWYDTTSGEICYNP